MNRIVILFFIFTTIICSKGYAQTNYELVQFSGIVVSGDSLQPVSFAHIMIEGTSRGTISDFRGFFSFVARPKDVIVFSSVGYRKGYFKIPDTLNSNHYTMFQVLQLDTHYLSEAVIYPWPSPSQFKSAFLNVKVPEDDYDRAQKNIAYMINKENIMSLPMDGSMNYKNFMSNQIQSYYTMGQLPVNNLLNPMAWAAFIKAWQSGDFKKTESNMYKTFPPD
jgi:hypothetical protein